MRSIEANGHLLSRDEARWIAANVAKVSELALVRNQEPSRKTLGANYVGFLAGVYVMIRALDNIEKGLPPHLRALDRSQFHKGGSRSARLILSGWNVR